MSAINRGNCTHETTAKAASTVDIEKMFSFMQNWNKPLVFFNLTSEGLVTAIKWIAENSNFSNGFWLANLKGGAAVDESCLKSNEFSSVSLQGVLGEKANSVRKALIRV